MSNYANNKTLLWLRNKEQAVPIAFPAVRRFIRKEIEELYGKTGAQRLDQVRYLKETPVGCDSALAWYSRTARPEAANGITFNLAKFDGLTALALRDIVRHEFAHHICHEKHTQVCDPHGEEWKNACKEVSCVPSATVRVMSFQGDLPRNFESELCRSKTAFLEGRGIIRTKQIAYEEMINGSAEAARFYCFLSYFEYNPKALPKALERMLIVAESDPRAKFIYAYIALKLGREPTDRCISMIREAAKSGARIAQYYYGKWSANKEYGLKSTDEGVKYLSEAVSARFAPAMIFWNDKYNDDVLLREIIELDVGDSGTELLPGEDIDVFVPYM